MKPAPDSDTPLPPGTRIGLWRLLECVGTGAFGRVYQAVLAHAPESTAYALKLARRPGELRFGREAEMLGRLNHPGVPRLHSSSVYEDERGRPFPFLVMEFIAGTHLYEWAHARRLTSVQVMGVLGQVARALEATHRHGLHRDVKGDNVLVRGDGQVVLVDFGACWLADGRPLTDTVIAPGTEPYRSPQIREFRERHWGQEGAHYRYQPEDELYAVGVMLFYLLTGGYPRSVADVESVEGWFDPVLGRLLRRLLAEEPRQRGTVSGLAEEMEQAARRAEPEKEPEVGVAELVPAAAVRVEPLHPRERARPQWARVPAGARARVVAPVQGLGLAVVLSGALALVSARLEPRLAPGGTRKEERVKLGSAALSPAPHDSAGPEERARAISAKVPGAPMPGQKRPPCEKGVVEIHKGCWVHAPALQLPCPTGWYEWKESCYAPLMASERLPTSEEP